MTCAVTARNSGTTDQRNEYKGWYLMMKKNARKIFALLMSGFLIAANGCGASDEEPVAEETTEENTNDTSEETENGDENNPQQETAEDIEEAETAETNTEPLDGNDLIKEIAQTPERTPSSVSSTPSRPTQEELLAGERRTLTGIVLDATRQSVSVQTTDGVSYYLTIPDTGVTGNLDYITIGQIATFTYAGSLDDTALLVDISGNGLVTGIYLEEYAFAIKIINAVKAMDMKALSDLTNFPVFLDTGNYDGPINTSGEFEVIDSEHIFTEALVNRIVNYNLFDLKYTDAGFVLGGNGTPNITFDVDDDGILGIIGINSAPANDNTKD